MSATADITPVAAAPAETPVRAASAPAALTATLTWPRLRGVVLALAFPVAVLVVWHFATFGRKFSLVPPPSEVALELYDLAFGGIFDDAYSGTLHVHLIASIWHGDAHTTRIACSRLSTLSTPSSESSCPAKDAPAESSALAELRTATGQRKPANRVRS